MSETHRHVAVIDIGKTNAKVVLHDLGARRDIAIRSAANEVRRDGPYPHFDAEGLYRFIVSSLAEIGREHRIDTISITTHGASAVLVDDAGLTLPMLDYEHDLSGPETDAYAALRPAFGETLSPRMAKGLNLGNQIFWLAKRFPREFAAARYILTYPQYWAWRLTGVAAFEPTSAGCHTDLWAPARGDFSSMVDALGWRSLFAPRRSAFDVLGPLKPEIAASAGLSGDIAVHCGIHDSNASLLPHLLGRSAPFAVISTGTWVVCFSVGGAPVALDPVRNTLANVDAFGRPVPCALFMGGREFDHLTRHRPVQPDEQTLRTVIGRRIMARPGQTAGTGPFPDGPGGWTIDDDALSDAERTASAGLYAALTTERALGLVGAEGPIVVEGPFARNALFLRALGNLTGRPVVAPTGGTGTSAGAAMLALGKKGTVVTGEDETAGTSPIPGLSTYRERWHAAATERADVGIGS